MNAQRLSWTRREPPLPVAAVACQVQELTALLAATARRVELGRELKVVSGPGGGVVLGAAEDLPWFPGAVYLGWDAGVLVPTTRAPSLPVDFLAPSLRRRLPEGHGLLALLPWGVLAAPVPRAAVDLAALQSHPIMSTGRPGASSDGGQSRDPWAGEP
jgi:hypothetical protein